MLLAGQGLLPESGRWGDDSWDIPPPVHVGSGVPLVSGTSHRRLGSSEVAWGWYSVLDILDKSTVHSVSLELVWQWKDIQPLLTSLLHRIFYKNTPLVLNDHF